MPQASIQINGVTGSNPNLPLGTLVQLNNNGSGGEVSWAWELVNIPPGSTAVLSNATIQNPTFTPDVEGTYLISVEVNGSGALVDEQVAGVHFLTTNLRTPAPGEGDQVSATDGWADSADGEEGVNNWLRLVNLLATDNGRLVAYATGVIGAGQTVQLAGGATIKASLPGQQVLPAASLALGNVASSLKDVIGVMEGRVLGGSTSAIGDLIFVRVIGLSIGIAGAFTVGQKLYVSNTGTLATSPGTTGRYIGTVVYNPSGSLFYAFIDGLGMNAARIVPDLDVLGAITVGGNATIDGTLVVDETVTATQTIESTTGDVIALAGAVRGNKGVEVPNTTVAGLESPIVGIMLYQEEVSDILSLSGGDMPGPVYLKTGNNYNGGSGPPPITTTEESIAGGSAVSNRPCFLSANVLQSGSTFDFTSALNCNGGSNDVTYNLRYGPHGNTLDPVIGTFTFTAVGATSNDCFLTIRGGFLGGGSTAVLEKFFVVGIQQAGSTGGLLGAAIFTGRGTVSAFDQTAAGYFTMSAVTAGAGTALVHYDSNLQICP